MGRIINSFIVALFRLAPLSLVLWAKQILPENIARGIHRRIRTVIDGTAESDPQAGGRPPPNANKWGGLNRKLELNKRMTMLDVLEKNQNRKIARLEDKLWRGHARYARADLEALRLSPRTKPDEARLAAQVLARYYAAYGDHDTALDRIAYTRAAFAEAAATRKIRTLEVNSLLALGRLEHVHYLLWKAPRYTDYFRNDIHMLWAMYFRIALGDGSDQGGHEPKLVENFFTALNEPIVGTGFSGVRRADPSRPVALDNLTAEPSESLPEARESSRVSVLMAAFNAEDTIAISLRGLLAQTFRNLEIIIVDDASSDATAEVAERLATEDSRIRVIRHQANRGAYAARNTALAQASGRYVVVNDTDDWPHPQKIETQAADMDAWHGQGANLTFRVRVDSGLTPRVRLDSIHAAVVHNDFSALMIARERVLAMGGWDSVRFAADGEFVKRLRVAEGKDPVRKLYRGVPLSFSLQEEKNLTASSASSIWTNRFGARQEYMRNFEAWHDSGDQLVMNRTAQTVPFPAPGIAYHGSGVEQQFDVLLVSDFRLPGGTTHSNLNYLTAFARAGLRVAILHWERYDIEPPQPGWLKIAHACREFGVVPLTHGETARCQLLLVHHPPIMMWEPDRIPDISTQEIVILANQSPRRTRTSSADVYDVASVNACLEQCFQRDALWIPISPVIRRILAGSDETFSLSEDDWFPVLDCDAWCRQPRWRGAEAERPVIGRHANDQNGKWPGSAEGIAAAYDASGTTPVRILGGALVAENILGYQPANWEVLAFDSEPVAKYLQTLDIFVALIHEDVIEAFGRNVLEAMAVGLPVICSPSYEETFGDAVIYATAEDVAERIDELWSDENRYLSQAISGQEFARQNCDLDVVEPRLARAMRERQRDYAASESSVAAAPS